MECISFFSILCFFTYSVRIIVHALIQKIYEDNASGKLSDERYATLSLSYEEKMEEAFQHRITERNKKKTA